MPICYIVTALPCTNVLPTDLCMCFIRVQAYQRGVMYPQFIFLHPAWWVMNWWVGDNTTENFTCTLEQRERVVYRSIAVLLYEYIENPADVAQTGTVSSLVFAGWQLLYMNFNLHKVTSCTCYFCCYGGPIPRISPLPPPM